MALEAQRADVLQVTLAPAFDDRDNMVRIPETFAPARSQTPFAASFQACRAPQAAKVAPSLLAIPPVRRTALIGSQADRDQ